MGVWCVCVCVSPLRGLLNALKIKAPGSFEKSGTARLLKERHISEDRNSQQRHCENLKSRKDDDDDDDDDDCSFNTCSSLLVYVMTYIRVTSYKVGVSTRNIIQNSKRETRTNIKKWNRNIINIVVVVEFTSASLLNTFVNIKWILDPRRWDRLVVPKRR